MITLYILIQCTQDEDEESSDTEEEEGGECSFDTSFIQQLTRNGNNTNQSSFSSDDCPAAVVGAPLF